MEKKLGRSLGTAPVSKKEVERHAQSMSNDPTGTSLTYDASGPLIQNDRARDEASCMNEETMSVDEHVSDNLSKPRISTEDR